ncbi:hypothetical protein Tco_0628283 [Tanacetum coccineum]|uniref:Uncharacterized protein n=1 Tax=Tanacetum coccineum TaxID=301880 RepID=A0ABQ4WPW8_9ASTR
MIRMEVLLVKADPRFGREAIVVGSGSLIFFWADIKVSGSSDWARFVPSTVFLLQEVLENEVFQGMQLIQKLRDDQKCMKKVEPSSRSKATEDIISIGSFVEVLVLNHYVLVRKILGKLSMLQDEDAQNKTNIQEPRMPWWWKFKRR